MARKHDWRKNFWNSTPLGGFFLMEKFWKSRKNSLVPQADFFWQNFFSLFFRCKSVGNGQKTWLAKKFLNFDPPGVTFCPLGRPKIMKNFKIFPKVSDTSNCSYGLGDYEKKFFTPSPWGPALFCPSPNECSCRFRREAPRCVARSATPLPPKAARETIETT